MTKPTPSTATTKRGDASGKKRNPPTALAGDGGLQSSSTNELEHEVNLPAQEQTHNPNFDRGDTNNPRTQEMGAPHSRDSLGRSDHSKVNEDQFSLDRWSRQVFSARIDATSKLLLLALGQLADEQGVCWPTQATLADMMNAGRGTVINAIARMEEAGWLLVDRERTAQGHKLHHYKLISHDDDDAHVQK